MLSAGKKITSNADSLMKIQLSYLYHCIKNPKSELEAKIRQLRIVRAIDPKKYSMLKKELPYVVCGMFNPPFRRTENFAYTEYFIVDIDHITQKGLSVGMLRSQLEQDARVVLSFLSPGEDGIKLVFKLAERCYDAGLYALFYKAFVYQLSQSYHLDQVLDQRTSDVCRACFISIDPDIYYNPEATPVNILDYIDTSNPAALFDLKKTIDRDMAEKKDVEENKIADDIDKEAIDKIKEILKISKVNVSKPPVYVPEQLDEIIDDLKKYIEETGLVVSEIININYGKKIRLKMGIKQAEINVFYGKRGFSVVESPRSGTNSELNKLTGDLIKNFFYCRL